LSHESDFKRAIEQIKLRAPIEEIVEERVPELKRSGNRLWACCPFHDEKTPSFSVEPRLGLWYCFGACSTGGDQINFVQRFDNLTFMEAVDILAARTGVELPKRTRSRAESQTAGAAWEALESADEFYREQLASAAGREAREYLARRELGPNTIEAFGLGFAPAEGQSLTRYFAKRSAAIKEACLETGLVRRNDSGRAYDFFRGRLMIPIRDEKGRTVGFGGRRLRDDADSGPKYINSPEASVFHKGRLVYALDRALDHTRRSGHLILVEGYTDVMALHQAGIAASGAVLGTATTDEHAALLRRAGARKVSLVFDGDEAGRNAALKALHGLLPLGIELEVVTLPAGKDPADVVAQDGAEGFLAQVELASDWFAFCVDGLRGLRGATLSRAVDQLLVLFGRIKKPVHREALLLQLADELHIPADSLRAQWRELPERRRALRAARERERMQVPEPDEVSEEAPPVEVDPRVARAFGGIVAAVLADASLVPLVRPLAADCPEQDLHAILQAVLELYEDEEALIDASSVIVQLGEHPARNRVASLVEHARGAEDIKSLFDGSLHFLRERALATEKQELLRRIEDSESASREGDEAATKELEGLLSRLKEIHQRGLQLQSSGLGA